MLRASELQKTHEIVHLEVGQPNFSTPVHIIESTIAALNQKKTAYIPNAGSTELRQVVSDRYGQRGIQTNASQIIITSGSMLAMFSLCLALLSPGDECLIPLPGFGNYQQMVSMVKANSVPYLCRPSEGYLPRIEELASLITARTRCIIICNPGNPTGAVFPPSLLRDIIELCQKRGVFVISDEIYSDIVFEGEHVSAASFTANQSDCLLAVVAGVSKGYAMTGYRVGWARCSSMLVEQLSKMQEPIVSCGVPFAQEAAIAALTGPQDCVKEMTAAYKERRDAALTVLHCRGRPSSFIPGGAFYLPVDISSSGLDSRSFALKLLYEKHCAVAPGIAFDTADDLEHPRLRSIEELQTVDGFCRVSLASSKENVVEGIHRICNLLDVLERERN
eukprot:gene25069-33582_t